MDDKNARSVLNRLNNDSELKELTDDKIKERNKKAEKILYELMGDG